jgi:hypothetical protein
MATAEEMTPRRRRPGRPGPACDDQDLGARMTKVLIPGSRKLSRLSPEVTTRIDTMIEKSFKILVGDANGVDKAVQRYLATSVTETSSSVAVAGENSGAAGARAFAYYSIRDQAMVDAAEYGLMLWDGESKGTLNSVIKMVRQGKPVVVDFAPKKAFRNLRSADDMFELLGTCDRASV